MKKRSKICIVIIILMLLVTSSKLLNKTTIKNKFDTLGEAIDDFYIEEMGYNNISIEDIDKELNMALLYTDEKDNQKGKRFYAITDYNIVDGKFALGNVRDETSIETQGNSPIELGHIVDGIGHVYQLILYNENVTMGKVELLLKNGDVFEKSVSNNNVFIPIEPLISEDMKFLDEALMYQDEDEKSKFFDLELYVESVTLYDSDNNIIWSNDGLVYN